MGIYNLYQIIRNAHITYKYTSKKRGEILGEKLKYACKFAKIHIAIYQAEICNKMGHMYYSKKDAINKAEWQIRIIKIMKGHEEQLL